MPLTSLLLAFLLTQAATPPAQTSASSDPDSPLLKAQALLNAGQPAQAEAAIRAILADQPQSAPAAYLLAHLLQQQAHPRESLKWFTKAASESPPAVEDLRSVALDYVLLDDYGDAARWLEHALQGGSTNAEAWYDLGRIRMMQNNFAGAEQALKKTLALQPRLVKAEDNLGVTYEGENRSADAEAAYRQAIEWQRTATHPSEQPLLNLGTLLAAQQHGAEAVPILLQAVAIAPGNPKCREQLARAYELTAQTEQTGEQTAIDSAQQQMAEAVRLDPANARLHYQLGLLYRRAGKPQQAKQEFLLSARLYGTKSTPDR